MDIVFEGVSKTFTQLLNGVENRIHALAPISFRIQSGEFFTLIGPSGCGKSTLLNVLAGLEVPDTGTVTLNGQPITAPGPDRAVVFQEAGLMPWMNVTENVEYGLKLQGVDPAERRARSVKYLKMVHMSKYAEAMPHQLSGGMRQRVSIARALSLEPKVLLMDEPFSALDAQTREVLHDELENICSEIGITVLFVTHNLDEAVYLSDRILIMTAAPGAIKRLVKVPFAHPRDRTSADLAGYVAQLHEDIREEVEKVAAREFDPEWRQDLQAVSDRKRSADIAGGI